MPIVRLDYDSYKAGLETSRIERLTALALLVEYPIQIRHSASGYGLHIKFTCHCDDEDCYNCNIYEFDDQRRLMFNKQRKDKGLSHNVLWDTKKGVQAEQWTTIKNLYDFLVFLDIGNVIQVGRQQKYMVFIRKAKE